mgnify:CR=1 FL=1
MKNLISTTFCLLILSACAAVYTDASDANHVTFLNSSGESIEQLTKRQVTIAHNTVRPRVLEVVIHNSL